jgi:hypothetical protein
MTASDIAKQGIEPGRRLVVYGLGLPPRPRACDGTAAHALCRPFRAGAPTPSLRHINILDAHRERRPDPCERIGTPLWPGPSLSATRCNEEDWSIDRGTLHG